MRVLITGFPHCGTTILRKILGHVDTMSECLDEMTIPPPTSTDNTVYKYPFYDPVFEQKEYSDWYIILVIRDPRYVFTSIEDRMRKNTYSSEFRDAHTPVVFERVCVSFIRHATHPSHIHTIRYEDFFPSSFQRIRALLDDIGLPYPDTIFQTETYSTPSHRKPHANEMNHAMLRAAQINKPFVYADESRAVNLSESTRLFIDESQIIQSVYPVTYTPPRILIGTPCFGASCSSNYTSSLLKTLTILRANNIECHVEFCNNQLTLRARNFITKTFLDGEYTHLFWIDADIHFNPDDVVRLVRYNRDIICGLYPNKGYMDKESTSPLHKKLQYAVQYLPNQPNAPFVRDAIIEVRYCATGFMCIRRDVFTNLFPHVDSYTDQQRGRIYNFWACAIVDDQYLTEDYNFCHMAATYLGTRVWADCSIALRHEGWHSYEGNPLKTFERVTTA